MVAMRELFERMDGAGRLRTRTVVRTNMGYVELMPEWADAYRPAGWKVYTTGLMNEGNTGFLAGNEWRFDKKKIGFPFLQQARAVCVGVVCAPKGVSLVPSRSPSDVGPAAKAFRTSTSFIYHFGDEPGMAEGPLCRRHFRPRAQPPDHHRQVQRYRSWSQRLRPRALRRLGRCNESLEVGNFQTSRPPPIFAHLTQEPQVSIFCQKSSRVPAKLCIWAMRGHTKKSTEGDDM